MKFYFGLLSPCFPSSFSSHSYSSLHLFFGEKNILCYYQAFIFTVTQRSLQRWRFYVIIQLVMSLLMISIIILFKFSSSSEKWGSWTWWSPSLLLVLNLLSCESYHPLFCYNYSPEVYQEDLSQIMDSFTKSR